ncbi:PP2C family serine/threonine-protein phosphatase [Streptomyces sp. WAC08241]|uniref:PP2C family serine/threonine-protein phosphatase n=1 Tax=Streptomyces sp. WAC08241 TaxID=2487421 RepID=UPI0021B04B24|nr:PP2C family serine/threonine-protein phosphatase [Streptomyces sp. WAC08241]
MHGIRSTGYRHLREGTPCQDALRYRRTSSGGLVLAVADGAGSAPRSREGAEKAVRLATDAFAPLVTPWRRLPDARARKEELTGAFRKVRDAFLDWCAGPPGPYATTLTVVVVAEGWLGQLSIGDGLVLVRAEEARGAGPGEPGPGDAGSGDAGREAAGREAAGHGSAREPAASYHLLPRTHTGSEYANETVFVGSPRALDQLRVDCVRDDAIGGVLLSTDGLTHALLRRSPTGPPLPHDAFLGHLFDRLARPDYDHDEEQDRLSAFLASDQITRVTGDDKTLLWAIRT